MEPNQVTLTGEKVEQESKQETNQESGKRVRKALKENSELSTTEPALAPPEQRGGDGCCPWCLAASETFKHHADGRVGCGNCEAVIPTDADWYQRGEKIII